MAWSANLANEAMKRGLKSKIPYNVTPGSEQIRATIEKDGLTKIFEDFGATVSKIEISLFQPIFLVHI